MCIYGPLIHLLKFYGNLTAQYHTRTVQFSDVNDIAMIYQWWVHASVNLQFQNYPYYQHDIRKSQVSTINKQHNTLSTVFRDEKHSREQFLKFSNLGHWMSLS